MSTFAFEATVRGLTGDAEQADRLFSERIQIVAGVIDGVGHLDVEVEASSSDEALHELDCHLRTSVPEIELVRVDEDLVTVTEISERIGQSRETVRLWSTGKRRSDFPAHRAVLAGGMKVWPWGGVFSWLQSRGLLQGEDVIPLSPESVDWFNGQLVTRRREPHLQAEELMPRRQTMGELVPAWNMLRLETVEYAAASHVAKLKGRAAKVRLFTVPQDSWIFDNV